MKRATIVVNGHRWRVTRYRDDFDLPHLKMFDHNRKPWTLSLCVSQKNDPAQPDGTALMTTYAIRFIQLAGPSSLKTIEMFSTIEEATIRYNQIRGDPYREMALACL